MAFGSVTFSSWINPKKHTDLGDNFWLFEHGLRLTLVHQILFLIILWIGLSLASLLVDLAIICIT